LANPKLTLYRKKPAKGAARVCQKYVGETIAQTPHGIIAFFEILHLDGKYEEI
jgi:hypothetical protein